MKKLALLIRILTVLAVLLHATSSNAEDKIKMSSYLPILPKGTDVSILIQTVEKNPKTLVAHQNGEFKLPASVQKLITALAAELELGPDFRFITRMQTTGKIVNKQLKGDLVIQMSGDPTFTRKQLAEMLAVLKHKGITQINGNIIIDSSIFMGHDKASGWSWNNLTSCYNTAPSAIIIDGNCFYAGVLPGKKIGEKATTSVSSNYPVTLTSNVLTISNKSTALDDKYCEFNISSADKNNYHLSGCIKHSTQKSYFKFAVTDSFDYFSKILKAELAQQKIKLTGKIIETKEPINKSLAPLAINQSAPLSSLLTVMLKKSNNLIADTLYRTIGAHYFNIPGSWKNSEDAIKAILLKKANINLENSVIMDGSGLSRQNLIDANKIMLILQYIAANNERLHMIDMLPTAGVDGTLQYRQSFANDDLKNLVHAKTGYLDGNYNLAGFIQQKDGKYLAFVQLVSGYNNINRSGGKKNKALIEFETKLYKDILKLQ